MKKRVALLLAAVLMLCAFSAQAASYTAKVGGSALFSVRYDDQYALDQYSYLGSGGIWFFILYDGAFSVDCGMEHTDRGAGYSLRGASDAAVQAYAAAIAQASGGTVTEIYRAGSQPFAIVSARRPGTGQVYYAETIVGGNAVYFEIYDMRSGSVDASALSALKKLLDGFTPLQ